MTNSFIHKVHWQKVFLAGVPFVVIATVAHQIEAALTMKFYQMPEYFGVWSKQMMPTQGPPPLTFFAMSLIFSYATGVALAAVFDYTKPAFPKSYWPHVLFFSDLMVSLALVFSTLPMYLMINLPLVLIASWFVSNFIAVTLNSMILAKWFK